MFIFEWTEWINQNHSCSRCTYFHIYLRPSMDTMHTYISGWYFVTRIREQIESKSNSIQSKLVQIKIGFVWNRLQKKERTTSPTKSCFVMSSPTVRYFHVEFLLDEIVMVLSAKSLFWTNENDESWESQERVYERPQDFRFNNSILWIINNQYETSQEPAESASWFPLKRARELLANPIP